MNTFTKWYPLDENGIATQLPHQGAVYAIRDVYGDVIYVGSHRDVRYILDEIVHLRAPGSATIARNGGAEFAYIPENDLNTLLDTERFWRDVYQPRCNRIPVTG